MSLHKILQTLEAQAAQEIAEIERGAAAEIESIRADAEEKAAAARLKHAPALAAPLQAEHARILNRAKLEALRTVMGAREELMQAAVAAAADRLAALPGDGIYARALEEMTCEAVAALGRDTALILRVESRDRPEVEQIVERWGLQATVEDGVAASDGAGGDNSASGDSSAGGEGVGNDTIAAGAAGNSRLHCPGGVVATTADGRIALDNTLGVRLQRVSVLHRSAIAAMLFDGRSVSLAGSPDNH